MEPKMQANLFTFIFGASVQTLMVLGCLSCTLYAMNEEKSYPPPSPATKSQSATIHIVSPEAVEITQRLQYMATHYPRIAQKAPLINSLEEFRCAKDYLNLSRNYEHIIFTVASLSVKEELLRQSYQILKGLVDYVNALRDKSCQSFRSAEDETDLEDNFYQINFKLGRVCLVQISKAALFRNIAVVQSSLQEIKDRKEIIARSKYRRLFQQEIEKVQELTPELIPFFNSTANTQKPKPHQKVSSKIEAQRTVNLHRKMRSLAAKEAPEAVFEQTFDPYYYLTTDKVLTEALSLSSQKLPVDVYIQSLRDLIESYKEVERKGLRFRAQLGSEAPSDVMHLQIKDLTKVYTFFCERFTQAHKSPVQLLENIIFLLIQSNQLEEALIRTEVLKALLLKRGPLSEQFIAFRASVFALNGNTDEWWQILEQKKSANLQKKLEQKQQAVANIKQSLEKAKTKQHPPIAPIPAFEKEASRTQTKCTKVTSLPEPYSLLSSADHVKYEVVLPREKVKTRKLPENLPIEAATEEKESSTNDQDSSSNNLEALKIYSVSKPAFKTYQKIRKDEWKFSRGELYNLFSKLGCKVDISQGKGDHGKIIFPVNMIVENSEGLVAVIPEFVNEDKNSVPMLTTPNWDEKWDGRVPPYMRKSILNALAYLRATDETVKKTHELS